MTRPALPLPRRGPPGLPPSRPRAPRPVGPCRPPVPSPVGLTPMKVVSVHRLAAWRPSWRLFFTRAGDSRPPWSSREWVRQQRGFPAAQLLLPRPVDKRKAGNNAMSVESERVKGFGKLEDGLRQASDWYLWGPYVSERQWGTVREDYSADGEAWDYLPHDHGPVAGLPVGRGRPGRLLRRRAATLPGPGPVERPGPDPQGAGLRPDGGRGQPRRGRQGVLVVPRRRPEPRLESLALPLPPGRLPLREPAAGERPAGQDRTRSTNCSIPVSSTTTATGSSRSTTPRRIPTTC